MYQPATRVLTVLELLQSRPQMTGQELAARLEVSPRTVRRYITMLQDLGIPVEAERGRHGAYRLAPGFRLPPLMFTEDEALALVLGLRVARRMALPLEVAAVEGALAKVERVLPRALRARLQALQDALVVYSPTQYAPPATETVLTLTTAVQQRRRVRLRYQDWRGAASERTVDPYGVVYYTGRWFAPGYCHLRQDVRLFRLDRVLSAELLPETETFERPANFDALLQVVAGLATAPGAWQVEVLLRLPLAEARQRVPPEMALLDEVPEGTLVRLNAQRLDWVAQVLAGLDCDLVVHHPPELRTALLDLSARVRRLAETT